jgi:hypothetical protein
VLPPEIPQLYIPVAKPAAALVYSPVILGAARVSFSDGKLGIDEARDVVVVTSVGDGAVAVDWEEGSTLDVEAARLRKEPEAADASFQDVPGAAAKPKNYAVWEKAFSQWLSRSQKIELFRHRGAKLTSKPGESEGDFRIRVGDAQRVARDAAVDALRQKYATKQGALVERLRKAEATVSRESEQSSQQKIQTALSVGASLLGALMGRKTISSANLGRVTTAARGVGRSMKESSDVTRASESAEAVKQQMQALEDQIRGETQALAASFDAALTFETVTLAPKRGQVSVQFVALGWDPS